MLCGQFACIELAAALLAEVAALEQFVPDLFERHATAGRISSPRLCRPDEDRRHKRDTRETYLAP